MSDDLVLIERSGRLGYLMLNRPDRLNAITASMRDLFAERLDELLRDPEIRVIIVRGAGRSFCAGYDLSPGESMEKTSSGQRTAADDLAWVRLEMETFQRLWDCQKPTIAQVHGHCVAGGAMLAMECDLVIAAEDALIGQPETRMVGLLPDHALWPMTIGIRRTKELLFTSKMVSGREAAEAGMINRAVPADELPETVRALAEEIAKTPLEMLAIQKGAANAAATAMGIDGIRTSGVVYDSLAHHGRSARLFRKTVREEGVRAGVKLFEDGV
jgi:enoyl-CoA hydratase